VIGSLALKNLKCFDELSLDLAPLTVLTGFNAAGKSTSLQTLLLLCQSLRAEDWNRELRLNGALVSLGTPRDILNPNFTEKGLSLGIGTTGADLSWNFGVVESESRRALEASSLDVRFAGSGWFGLGPEKLAGLVPKDPEPRITAAVRELERLVFLSALRQVETDVFPIPENLGESPGDVGCVGQFAAWWVHQEGDSPIQLERSLPSAAQSRTLRAQLNAWTGEIFPGAEINALPVPRTNLVRLEIRTGATSEYRRPANVGYGVSYAFPLLVAGLPGASDRPVIVDSPEAHLHPRGQSRIGAFLAQMAASGSQFLIETHSDHVLSGVRLAVRSGMIKPEQVALYFFRVWLFWNDAPGVGI
jgi:energy-coupling factor transporter ATP-binding protein EcfA2